MKREIVIEHRPTERKNLESASRETAAFVRDLLGLPAPKENMSLDESADQRRLREFVSAITSGHDESITEEQQREFLVSISTAHESMWDPSKHPRGGYPANPGWFSPSGSGGGAVHSARTVVPLPSLPKVSGAAGTGPVGGLARDEHQNHQLAQNQQQPAAPQAQPQPRKSFDADAVKKAGIIVKKDPGQPVAAAQTGGANWTVPWDTTVAPGALPGSNKGWIVQHVTVDVQARDQNGFPIKAMTRAADGTPDVKSGGQTQNVQDKYLEAWRVDSPFGQFGGKVRAGEDASQNGTDTFLVAPERPATRGRVIVMGKVLFVDEKKGFPDNTHPKWNWPSRGGPKRDPTYILPSTRDPAEIAKFNNLPNASQAADHWMVYEWDTTDPARPRHVRYGGLGVAPPTNLEPIR
jgi:hypothetical protein